MQVKTLCEVSFKILEYPVPHIFYYSLGSQIQIIENKTNWESTNSSCKFDSIKISINSVPNFIQHHDYEILRLYDIFSNQTKDVGTYKVSTQIDFYSLDDNIVIAQDWQIKVLGPDYYTQYQENTKNFIPEFLYQPQDIYMLAGTQLKYQLPPVINTFGQKIIIELQGGEASNFVRLNKNQLILAPPKEIGGLFNQIVSLRRFNEIEPTTMYYLYIEVEKQIIIDAEEVNLADSNLLNEESNSSSEIEELGDELQQQINFAKLSSLKKAKNYGKQLTAYISRISFAGTVFIKFSHDMKIWSQSQIILQKSLWIKMLKPDDSIEYCNYNVTEFVDNILTIRVFFQDLKQVSQDSDKDMKLSIAKNYEMSKSLPPQISESLSKSMQLLWDMISGFQYITHLPLMTIRTPANIQLIFKSIIDISNFQFISTDNFDKIFFNMTEFENQAFAHNSYFDILGYQSVNLINNLGLIFYFLFIVVILIVLERFSQLINAKIGLFKRYRKRVNDNLYFSFILRFAIESQLELCICSSINILRLTFTFTADSIGSILSIILLTFCSLFPVISFYALQQIRPRFHQYFKTRFSPFDEAVIDNLHFKPYLDPTKNSFETFNEVCIITIIYGFIPFLDTYKLNDNIKMNLCEKIQNAINRVMKKCKSKKQKQISDQIQDMQLQQSSYLTSVNQSSLFTEFEGEVMPFEKNIQKIQKRRRNTRVIKHNHNQILVKVLRQQTNNNDGDIQMNVRKESDVITQSNINDINPYQTQKFTYGQQFREQIQPVYKNRKFTIEDF
eukprot:403360239